MVRYTLQGVVHFEGHVQQRHRMHDEERQERSDVAGTDARVQPYAMMICRQIRGCDRRNRHFQPNLSTQALHREQCFDRAIFTNRHVRQTTPGRNIKPSNGYRRISLLWFDAVMTAGRDLHALTNVAMHAEYNARNASLASHVACQHIRNRAQTGTGSTYRRSGVAYLQHDTTNMPITVTDMDRYRDGINGFRSCAQ